MKKLTILFFTISCLLISGCSSSKDSKKANEENLLKGTHHVEMNIQDMGKIALELDGDVAPITVTNFINLAKKGFYDGLSFHRIIDGFMIQGGDPNKDGTGGSKDTITGEFSANDIENTIAHKRGVISMARSQSYDSGSSQFFIMLEDASHLDGEYAAFGHVTDGMDIVDKIAKEAIVEDDNGSVAVKNQPIITSIKVID